MGPRLHPPIGFAYGNPKSSVGGEPTDENLVSEEALQTMRERGDGWAAYMNMAMDSRALGHLQFIQYGPTRVFKSPDDLREQAPDTQHGTGWKYRFVGYVRLSDGAIVEEP